MAEQHRRQRSHVTRASRQTPARAIVEIVLET
jgi:hypothetical protein